MKRAYIAESLVDGQLVADWLQGNGIPCEIFNQNSVGALGELPVTPPEVWVKRDPDLVRAQHLVTEIFRTAGNENKTCNQCNEISPAGFDICWQCQSPLSIV